MATSAGQRKRSICMVDKSMFNTKVHFEMLVFVFERHERWTYLCYVIVPSLKTVCNCDLLDNC